jgi:chromate transporter
MESSGKKGTPFEVFRAALKLGLTSFGGPIAHLGYFHQEYVVRRKWMDDQSYADTIAYANSLPGAASSKVGIIIGTHRAGILGGLAAWVGFTTPSALILIAFGLLVSHLSSSVTNASWLHGLQIAAVAIVFQAVLGMGRRLVPDVKRAIIAGGSTVASLALVQFIGIQILIIIVSGLIGWIFLRNLPMPQGRASIAARIPRWLSISSVSAFFVLLGLVPVLEHFAPGDNVLAVFYAFYSSGALVFGGGHVVLPLLRSQVVTPGWVSTTQFLAGYGLTQAMPGPIFTFSAYLGTVLNIYPNGIAGGLFALFAIFLPSFLLVYGPLPFWNSFRTRRSFQSALAGVNAGVVGILLAALYNPIFITGVTSIGDFALAIGLILLLIVLKRPPWNIVLVAALGGLILGLLGLA